MLSRSIFAMLLGLTVVASLASCASAPTPTPLPTPVPSTPIIPNVPSATPIPATTQTPFVVTATLGPSQTPNVITATPGPSQTPIVIVITVTAVPSTATAVPASPTPVSNTQSQQSTIIYFAPTLLDPPNGREFSAKNTILRWKQDQDLKSDEVYSVMVWPESGEQSSIGDTRDGIFPIDFLTWKYAGRIGKFFWTIQIKRVDGTYLSGASQPFWFKLYEYPPPPTPKPYP